MKQHRTNNMNAMGYFNLLRGYGIFFVLVFHTRILYFQRDLGASNFLTIFGGGLMAMFFIVSGFGFFKRKPLRCLKTQFNLIFVPYMFMCAFVLLERLIYDIIRGIPFAENGGSLVLTYLFGLCVIPERTVLGFPVSYVGLFWFLLSLFVGWIIYNQVSQLKNKTHIRICVAICVLLGWILPLITDLWPYCLPQGLLTVGCLYIGENLRKNKLLDKNLPPAVYVIALIWIGISVVFGSGDMGTNYWKLGLFDVISAYLIGIAFIKLYSLIYSYIPENKLANSLEVIGAESFLIFCIHGVERVIIPWYVIQRFISNPYLGTVIYFILRCVLIYIAYKIVKKLQRFMNNKKRKNKTKVKITLE